MRKIEEESGLHLVAQPMDEIDPILTMLFEESVPPPAREPWAEVSMKNVPRMERENKRPKVLRCSRVFPVPTTKMVEQPYCKRARGLPPPRSSPFTTGLLARMAKHGGVKRPLCMSRGGGG